MSNYEEIENKEEVGSYLSDMLIDRKIMTKVKNHGELCIKDTEGINRSLLERLNRENIIYYGLMQGEQLVRIEQANSQFQVPIIQTNQISKRLEKIKENHRNKIGYIHINTIQITLRSTFREGIKTPVKIKIEDNRIMQKEYALLGSIDGDLGYGVIKFNVALQYPIPLSTRKFNNCIGITCDFKNKELMEKGDIPLVACYGIAYALSNSALSMNYKNLDRLYTETLFNKTSTIIRKDKIQENFLKQHSRRFPNLQIGEGPSSLSNSLIPRNSFSGSLNPKNRLSKLEEPLTKTRIQQEETQIDKINKKVEELNSVITELSNKI